MMSYEQLRRELGVREKKAVGNHPGDDMNSQQRRKLKRKLEREGFVRVGDLSSRAQTLVALGFGVGYYSLNTKITPILEQHKIVRVVGNVVLIKSPIDGVSPDEYYEYLGDYYFAGMDRPSVKNNARVHKEFRRTMNMHAPTFRAEKALLALAHE